MIRTAEKITGHLWIYHLLATLALALATVATGLVVMGGRDSSPEPPERAAAAGPYQRVVLFEGYELAAALNPWGQVVGISRYALDNDLMKRLVPHLGQIPTPGSGFEVNLEALLGLQPDLVVTWSRKPETVESIKRRGITVLSIYPEGLADLRRDFLRLGQALGREARAREVLALMDRSLEKLRAQVAALAAPPPRVLWLWGKPTVVSGNKGVVPELMQWAGGNNLGGHLEVLNQELSMESIVDLNPEVVLIWGSATYGPDNLCRDLKWQTVQAVKDRRVFKAARHSTWSPRAVILAWWMAHHFYPHKITAAAVKQAAAEIYQGCYGIPYEEQP